MYNYDNCSPTVTNCTFSGNSAPYYGGGMRNSDYCSPTVTNCTFSGNTARYGGGMDNRDDSSPVVANCTFTGNSATYDGGGMHNSYSSNPLVTNGTFSRNTAYWGGGMYNCHNNPTVTNCIVWGNAADVLPQFAACGTSTPTVVYSDVQDGTGESWFGVGCIDADPLFVGGPSGTWTVDGVYDPATGITTLTDAGAAWAVDELMDKLVNPNTTRPFSSLSQAILRIP